MSHDRPNLIFLHIGKTGGTTLRGIILRQYGRDAVFELNFTRDFQEFLDLFERLPLHQKARVQVFMGHMAGFGLHKFLPGPSVYVTVLRNPVERIISSYYHALRLPNAPLDRGLSLFEWIEQAKTRHNAQTKVLAGYSLLDAIPATGEMLTIAKRHIQDHFALVGLVERYDESLILMKRALGWRLPVYVKSNVAPNRPQRASPSLKVLQAIEEHNRLDMELYRHAAERFEEMVKQAGQSFRIEVRTLQHLSLVAEDAPFRPALRYCLRAMGRA